MGWYVTCSICGTEEKGARPACGCEERAMRAEMERVIAARTGATILESFLLTDAEDGSMYFNEKLCAADGHLFCTTVGLHEPFATAEGSSLLPKRLCFITEEKYAQDREQAHTTEANTRFET